MIISLLANSYEWYKIIGIPQTDYQAIEFGVFFTVTFTAFILFVVTDED